MLLTKMFARVAIATDNAGQGPIVTARDELRSCRATFFGHKTRTFYTLSRHLFPIILHFQLEIPPPNGSGQDCWNRLPQL